MILSEKRPKNLKKYLVADVPFEFKNKEQFNFQVAQPLGVEWNGLKTFKDNIKPRMLKEVGQTIAPIQKNKLPKTKHL